MANAHVRQSIRKQRRARRTRSRIHGTAECPRLSVFRSLKHFSLQLIDDLAGRTLAMASDRDLKATAGTPTERAHAVGMLLAERAKAMKITQVVFDRGSFLYHGRVKAAAEGARAGGLTF